MIKAGVPDASRPYNTYFEGSRDFPFNGEPVILYHDESALNDTGTVVMFRRSDVVATAICFRRSAIRRSISPTVAACRERSTASIASSI